MRAAARERRQGSMRALVRRDELRARRLAVDREQLTVAPGPNVDHLREVAANTRDFARRNSSRAGLSTLDQSSIDFRLVQAETALRWAGYTLGPDGTWNLPAAD